MWNKLSFRLKITVIFFGCLLALTAILTTLSLMNVQQNISNPMSRLLVVSEDEDSRPLLVTDDGSRAIFYNENHWEELSNMFIEGQVYEQIDLSPEGALIVEETGVYGVERLQEQLDVAQHDFRQYSFWVAGIVIILGSLGAYLIAGIIVHPIKELSTVVKGIEADNLHESLPLSKSHDEISQLTISFNGMLDKLHRSFASKQLFAQNAAHELKTPLAIIRAHMEALVMEDNPTADDYEDVFVEVKNSTERMIGLVEGLLAMGKPFAEADMTVFQGRELFEGIFFDLKDAIHSKQLNVKTIGDLTIKGEKMQLHQAFFNLIHNAVRYNIEGGNIIVTMGSNQITIDDTGIGIPSESIGQLFDPFYCVDKSRSKKLGGNGLGLSITKNILDAHHMSIDITSSIGVGTLITIHI